MEIERKRPEFTQYECGESMAASAKYSESVFINCPFDKKYVPILRAIVFAVFDAGLVARTSLEFDDATGVRIDKVLKLIEACQYGIHDISRTELDRVTGLPRFNMPLEFGIFLGAKVYGSVRQKKKTCLILDTEPYRYQKFISDIAGQDIYAHNNNPKTAVKTVRAWLATNSHSTRIIPGGDATWKRYQRFVAKLPDMLRRRKLKDDEAVFKTYAWIVREWLRLNP